MRQRELAHFLRKIIGQFLIQVRGDFVQMQRFGRLMSRLDALAGVAERFRQMSMDERMVRIEPSRLFQDFDRSC